MFLFQARGIENISDVGMYSIRRLYSGQLPAVRLGEDRLGVTHILPPE